MMKDDEKDYRRQLIFDMDTKIAEHILGSSYRSIYKDIREFLAKKDFEHIEGSGYISKKTLSDTQIFRILKALKKQYPYLNKCIRDIRVADIIELNSLNHIFDYDGTPGKYVAQPMEHSKAETSNSESKKSLLGRLEHTKAQVQKNKTFMLDSNDHKKDNGLE